MAEKILIVDDEVEIADLLAVYLENENYQVYKFYSGIQAFECVRSENIDLAILDVMMPDMDGLELCRRIRESHHYPVIMLTAKDQELDKITGLALGADDYITKPFRPLEVVARVKAQLRRYKRYNLLAENSQAVNQEEVIILRGLTINKGTHDCYLNEERLELTPTEFSILCILCEEKGNVVSSESLFKKIWQDEYYTKNNNTITVHIRHLREKMKDSFDKPQYIKTVWGVGYKIER